MQIASLYMRSLLLAGIVSFCVPVVLVSGLVLLLCLLSLVPWVDLLCQPLLDGVCLVLSTFGEGHPLSGLLTIGVAFGVVGTLFDSYILYRQRSLS